MFLIIVAVLMAITYLAMVISNLYEISLSIKYVKKLIEDFEKKRN